MNDEPQLQLRLTQIFDDPEALAALELESRMICHRIAGVAFMRWISPYAVSAKAIVDRIGETHAVLSRPPISQRLSERARIAVHQWHHWHVGNGLEGNIPGECFLLHFTKAEEIEFDALRDAVVKLHSPGSSRRPDGETVARIKSNLVLLAQLKQHGKETDDESLAKFLQSCLTWNRQHAKRSVQP